MSSGLYIVVLVNIIVAWLGILVYRYIILPEAGPLSPQEIRLLRKYPSVRAAQSYTPTDAFVRAAPPMRWTVWPDFFKASEASLSRDAQVYLLFQRACILTTALCSFTATLFLLPTYWFGGAVFDTDSHTAPNSLLSLLKSDRGIFERFTSHNLPPNSPLLLLQFPVFFVASFCIAIMYTVVKAAAGEQRTIEEWLHPSSTPTSPLNTSSPRNSWTLFARGLPENIQVAEDLASMLDVLYPGQIVKVELVCKGKMSEARLLRALSFARNRLDYLYETSDDPNISLLPAKQGPFAFIFTLHAKPRTREVMIQELEEEIRLLQKDFESRKAEPVRGFMGCAFITFRTSSATTSALRDFPINFADRSEDISDNGITGEGETHRRPSFLNRLRRKSEMFLPSLHCLRWGLVNLLPYNIRERIFSISHSGLSYVAVEEALNNRIGNVPERSPVSVEVATVQLRNMKAVRAPKSGDIIWENIGISFFERTVREMVVQVIVFTILILFTSPVAMLTATRLVFAEMTLLSDPQMIFSTLKHGNSSLSEAALSSAPNETNGFDALNSLSSNGGSAMDSISNDLIKLLPSFVTTDPVLRSAVLGYLPVLILAIVFAIVPSLLRLTCAWEGYPTHSAQEMSVFRKTSFYYVMNAVVLPSVALNTASEFMEMVYNQSGGGANVYNALPILKRLFSGDIAFFICNYLVQLALTGSVFWLLRVPSSFSMMVRRRLAVTPLEKAEAKCTDIFDYPRHYAYNVTVMSMCLLFGFMAPLVWYFALLYFLCKHCVDVYTIRYVHPRSHIDGRLPRLSSNFVLIWMTVSQLSLALIFYMQDFVKAGIATALLCFLTLATCLCASPSVGNRIVKAVTSWRDHVIERIIQSLSTDYDWMTSPSPRLSSTNSSSLSIPDSREEETLLSKDPMVRRISLEIEGLRHFRTSSVRGGPSSPSHCEEFIGTTRISWQSQSGFIGNLTPDSIESCRDCKSESDEEEFVVEDIEYGESSALQYGSCNGSEADGKEVKAQQNSPEDTD